MPVLRELLSKGARASLSTVTPPFSAPAWTTFSTGCLPGRHGIFDFIQGIPGSYDVRTMRGGDRRVPPLWKILDENGMAAAAVNVPMTYPPDALNHGVMVSGLDAPAEGPDMTHPPDLWKSISALGDYRIYPSPGGKTISRYAEDLWRMMKLRAAVFLDLALRRDTRLGILVLETVDMMGHLCLGADDEAARGFLDLYYESYERIDAVLGEIVEKLPAGAALAIVSDHGMRPLNKFVLLDQWLINEKLLVLKEGGAGSPGKPGGVLWKMARAGLSAANRMIPGAVRTRLGRFKQVKNRMEASLWNRSVDWRATRAFTCNMQGIYINAEGNFPDGCVSEKDYPVLMESVKEKLLCLKDPETGDAVIGKILDRDEAYPGPASDTAPDLYIIWKEGYEGQLRRQGHLFRPPSSWPREKPLPADCRDIWKGDHSPEGIFLAAGPGIRKGVNIGAAALQDIAPTVLAALGLPVPGRMDGRVLGEIFDAPPVVSYSKSYGPYSAGGGDIPEEEEKARRERLKNLGYL